MKRFLVILPLSLLLLCSFDATLVLSVNEDEVNQAINHAENALVAAFESVLVAEKVGANVSGLIAKLNQAVNLLTVSQTLLIKGKLDDALAVATSSLEIADSVIDDSIQYKISALALHETLFKRYVKLAILGTPFFLAFMFLLWLFFERYYTQKMLFSSRAMLHVGSRSV